MRIFRGAFLFFIICAVLTAAAFGVSKNLLTNGSFESGLNKYKIPKGWGTEAYNQSVVGGAKVGKKCLRIHNSAPQSSMGAQSFSRL